MDQFMGGVRVLTVAFIVIAIIWIVISSLAATGGPSQDYCSENPGAPSCHKTYIPR